MFRRGDKPKPSFERSPGVLGRYLGGGLANDGPGGIREWREQLAEAETKIGGAHHLWQREWAAITVRGLLKSIDPAEAGSEELFQRCARLREKMRALDEAEFAPLRARLAAGE